MGCRATVIVMDEQNLPLVRLYRHWDGSPGDLGQELHDFLVGSMIVNGSTDDRKKHNAMAEFAARLVMEQKARNPCGNVYLESVIPANKNLDLHDFDSLVSEFGGSYTYIISIQQDRSLQIAVYEKGQRLYQGDAEGMRVEFGLK